MRETFAAFSLMLALPAASFALSLGLGARAYGDAAGAFGGTYAAATAERYAELGASSFSALGSSSILPAFAYGGGLEFDLGGLFAPRFSLAIGAGYGLWGAGLVGKDSSGKGFASTLWYAPVLDLSAEARYAFRVGPGSIEPGLGAFVGAIFPKYKIEERISGVGSSVDPSPLAADALVLGLRASAAYALRLGPGDLRLGLSVAVGQSLASAAGSLGASILWPWRAGLDLGYVYYFAGGKK